MKYSITITALLTGVALSIPVAIEQRQAPYTPCSGLYSSAQCCATDVLGVADLDCANPSSTPTNATDFQALCADVGQRARCCTLPVLGQDLLCQTPTGVTA